MESMRCDQSPLQGQAKPIGQKTPSEANRVIKITSNDGRAVQWSAQIGIDPSHCSQCEVAMTDELLFHRGTTMVRRLRLAPGEVMPWHRDPFQRVAIVVSGDVLSLDYRDGGESSHIEVTPGQVDWEEPTSRVHRAVNVGKESYEQVTVFLLDHPDAVHQPIEE